MELFIQDGLKNLIKKEDGLSKYTLNNDEQL